MAAFIEVEQPTLKIRDDNGGLCEFSVNEAHSLHDELTRFVLDYPKKDNDE